MRKVLDCDRSCGLLYRTDCNKIKFDQVVELLSTVIEHLVKGEIMQMKPSASGKSALEYYLRKNYYKTASLMGHSCLAAAVLGE